VTPPRSVLLGLTGLGIEGGIASVSRCVVRALEERVAAGSLERVDRVLLAPGEAHAVPPPRAGVERQAGGSQARFVLEFWRTALRRPDLVFFDHVGLAQTGQLPLPGLRGRRQAIFVHGIELSAAREGRRAEALRRAWRIVVNSEYTAGLVEALDASLAPKIRVAPLCIDPARIEGWRALESDAGAPPEKEPAALIVGRMMVEERGKGHDDLIAAWPEVLRRVPAARLWVAGGGDDRERLERDVRAAGLGEAVLFLGRISESELHDRMRRASVLAMPSRQEGFGLVYAEAAWLGTPSLGSGDDAARHVIRDGETGTLVPFGDRTAIAQALVAFLGDPERAARMGRAGQADARERFAYPRFRRDLLAALELPEG
jgi:phosphatidylinositol alpha-1,6-mannosyltransferase